MEVFNEVEIETIYGEPTCEEVDGILVAKDNSLTSVNISNETIEKIQNICSGIRDGIIS